MHSDSNDLTVSNNSDLVFYTIIAVRLITSVHVIFALDTVVSYYCIYYEYYLNRR